MIGTLLQLDHTDQTILGHLQEQARLTNLQLAQYVDLSPASTLERVRKLENKGVIKSYQVKIDPKKLGLDACIFVLIKLKKLTAAHIEEFKKSIQSIPEVIVCHQMMGDADFLIKVVSKDIAAYQQLVIDQLSPIDCIGHMQSFIITDTIKETGIPVSVIQKASFASF